MIHVHWQCEVWWIWSVITDCRSVKSKIHQFWGMEFSLSLYSDIGKWIRVYYLIILDIPILQNVKLSFFSFKTARSISITSIDWIYNFFVRCISEIAFSCNTRKVLHCSMRISCIFFILLLLNLTSWSFLLIINYQLISSSIKSIFWI